uniref:Cystatin domain-containing protein n=1 Tax=Paramoeba aestuarina TaxID=180227 RepID=A0A7S4L5V6_9EUKA
MKLFLVLACLFAVVSVTATLPAGFWSSEQPATKEIQELVDSVYEKVEDRLGREFNTYIAVSYQSQVVAGTNYHIKMKIDGQDVNLDIFQDLMGVPHLTRVDAFNPEL